MCICWWMNCVNIRMPSATIKKLTLCQTGFTNGNRTVENILILKTYVDKYLTAKTDGLHCSFVDSEKECNFTNRGDLCFKIWKSISTREYDYVKIMHHDIKFWVKCGENQIFSCVPQTNISVNVVVWVYIYLMIL